MKRVTFLWLWVCALLWGAGVQVWGAPVTFVVDCYKYIVRSGESQRVTLSAIPRGVKDIVIPSSVQHEGVDYSVVWIGGDAIIASSIHSLSIPATVEGFSDEKYAFDDCDQLEKVTVDPSSEFFFLQYDIAEEMPCHSAHGERHCGRSGRYGGRGISFIVFRG